MERLTRRSPISDATFFSAACGAVCRHHTAFCDIKICDSRKNRTCPYLAIIDRLAAYEDSGLTPEEVKAMAANLKRGDYQ